LIDDDDNLRWLDAARFDDPTIFALGHHKGFSGSAWAGKTGTPPETLNWLGEPSFLGPSIDNLGGSFVAAAGLSVDSDAFSSERRIPTIEVRTDAVSPFERTSRVIMSPNLQRRGLVFAPELPGIRSAESVRDSIVEIDVDSSGGVFSCRLANERRRDPIDGQQKPAWDTSDLQRKADSLALAHARQFRFRSKLMGGNDESGPTQVDLNLGRLRIQWGYDIEPQKTGVDKQ
jgi:hypothetical protein